jgi:hypothetical protein
MPFGSNLGPPMLPNNAYNDNYTVVRNADHVLHGGGGPRCADRLREPSPLPEDIPPWLGDSWGQGPIWEGPLGHCWGRAAQLNLHGASSSFYLLSVRGCRCYFWMPVFVPDTPSLTSAERRPSLRSVQPTRSLIDKLWSRADRRGPVRVSRTLTFAELLRRE